MTHIPPFKVQLWDFTEPSKLRGKAVQSASVVNSKIRYLQTVLDNLRTQAGFCRASFSFPWLKREHWVGFISLRVSDVVSKPEIVMQVLSASPFATERSCTKHGLPTIYDQGETSLKNCHQREGITTSAGLRRAGVHSRAGAHQVLTPSPESPSYGRSSET